VIAGHRDTHFSRLDHLGVGQVVTVQRPDGGEHEYRVVDWAVVDESDTAVMAETGRPTLLLATCYPLDAIEPGGRLRYVVWAELVQRCRLEG
jgi:sortase A